MAINEADLIPFLSGYDPVKYLQNANSSTSVIDNPQTPMVEIPKSNIPGTKDKISGTYKRSADNIRIVSDLLPYLTDAVNQQALPSALTALNVAQATSGPYAQLMVDLYNQYGPQLNAIGNEINRRNAVANAQTDKEVLTGAGTDLVKAADKLQREQDPEYYATRANTADSISKLLSSIDLSGGLSNTERDEIQKGLAIEGVNRGTANAPSNLETVANAMQYGQAGRNRILQNQNALTAAINASTAFIPTTKSGVDVFQVATGKSSQANSGNSLFTGINQGNNATGNNFASQLLSNNQQTQLQRAQKSANSSMNGFQKFNSLAGGIGGLLEGVGSFGKIM